MLKCVFSVGIFVTWLSGFSQTIQDPDQLKGNLSRSVPISAGAAAIEKFNTIPVSYSTGVASISYPMWSWEKGKLNFSVGLGYHSGGNKVQDMASNVGMGWALNCGGRIARTVKGVRDDHITRGYMYTPALPDISTALYDPTQAYPTSNMVGQPYYSLGHVISTNNGTSGVYSLVQSIVDGWLDAEQDIFSYNIPGASGRFVFDKNKTVVKLEYNNVKILPLFSAYLNGQPNGDLVSFSIIDENGVEYLFDQLLQQTVQTFPSSLGVPNETVNSEWLLTRIKDPISGDFITLSYANGTSSGPMSYETSFSQVQRYSYTAIGYSVGGTPYLYNNFHPDNDLVSYSVISGGEATPSVITMPDGSTVTLSYEFDRADFVNSKALTTVVVKNGRNEIVKQFTLHYSYFDCTLSTIATPSSNDYSKRLRLDEIKELSIDGLKHKATKFSYNATPMNARNSRNLDYWGYNVDPSRNNFDYVPKIRFGEVQYFDFLPGGDRSPDAVYTKAGILERIEYPTGGYSMFEYESNKAFSPINYYENESKSNTLWWQQADFNNSFKIFMNGRTETAVSFFFKAEEFNPRPVPDPNGPQLCLTQDGESATFQIIALDGSYTANVTDNYGNFLSGKTAVVNLPTGKAYSVKFLYNIDNCSFQYPFKISAVATFYITQQDKLAGGLRIKKVISDEGSGVASVKEYDYNNPDGHSSAYLDNIPNYNFYKTVTDVGTFGVVSPPASGPLPQIHLNRNSEPMNTVNYSSGAPLIYARVTEKFADGSSIIREYDPAVYSANEVFYPYTPGQEFQNLSGLQTKEIIKDNLGNTKREQTMQYNKVVDYIYGNHIKSFKTGMVADATDYNNKHFVAKAYWPKVSRAELMQVQTSQYENGQVMTQTETNSYNSWYAISNKNSTNSKGEGIVTEYAYPYDHPSVQVYNTMVQMNMLTPVVSTNKSKAGILNGALLSQKANYGFFNSTMPLPANVQKSNFQNPLETELTFDSYDDKGNVTQYTGKDGITTVLIWGYKKQYVVAKVVGSSYAVASALLNASVIDDPSSDAVMRAELNNLRTINGALVQTFTHKPLVGITSETDANGRTIYYEYDNFNRLKLVRDKDNNIIKRICYNYKGDQTDCAETIVLPNTCPDCTGPDKKCINNVCVTGQKILVSSEDMGNNSWKCTYRYEWNNGTIQGPTFIEYFNFGCLIPW